MNEVLKRLYDVSIRGPVLLEYSLTNEGIISSLGTTHHLLIFRNDRKRIVILRTRTSLADRSNSNEGDHSPHLI